MLPSNNIAALNTIIWRMVSGLLPERWNFLLRDWNLHLSNVSKISLILSMLRLLLKKSLRLNHSTVRFSRNWQKSCMQKVIWKTRKESCHRHSHSMPEINSICSIRKYTRMCVWWQLLLLLSVSLAEKQITGCGPVIPVTSLCSVFMRMPTESRQNTVQAILPWKQKNICLFLSRAWKKETMPWLWDFPEVQAVIWPYRK